MDGRNGSGQDQTPHERERDVMNDILRWSAGRTDLRLWRINNGTFLTPDMNRVVQVGLPGAADLSGIINGGRRLEIECKSKTGKQRKEQVAFERMINRLGGIYVLARSVKDVEDAIKEYIQ